jgi:hypothetical protein
MQMSAMFTVLRAIFFMPSETLSITRDTLRRRVGLAPRELETQLSALDRGGLIDAHRLRLTLSGLAAAAAMRGSRSPSARLGLEGVVVGRGGELARFRPHVTRDGTHDAMERLPNTVYVAPAARFVASPLEELHEVAFVSWHRGDTARIFRSHGVEDVLHELAAGRCLDGARAREPQALAISNFLRDLFEQNRTLQNHVRAAVAPERINLGIVAVPAGHDHKDATQR